MPQLQATVTIPPLPAGWIGNPDDLLQFFREEMIINVGVDLPSGQIGGSAPTEDIGVWYSPNGVETYRDGKYKPITDVPIGTIIATAGLSATPPANYLFANGAEVNRTTYEDLFSVIGEAWGTPTSEFVFKLPNLAGRVIIGEGTADYNDNTFPAGSAARVAADGGSPPDFGKGPPQTKGQYVGTDIPLNILNSPAGIGWPDIPINAALTAYFKSAGTGGGTGSLQMTTTPAVVLPCLIRYR